MIHSYLEYARINHQDALEKALREVAAGQPDPDAYFAIGFAWRVLALCALLRDADTHAFAACLAKSGQVRLHLLQRVQQGMACPPLLLCTSKDIFFAASLAAGDLDTARAIAQLAPQRHFANLEYEDDFLFYHFLHRALLAPDDTVRLEALLQRWEDVLEGGESAYRDVCRELLSGQPERFESGFTAFLQERQEALREYAESFTCNRELLATEGKIFIEGLAVLRLADLRGLPTQPQYPLIPRMARLPPGTPLPPPASWRKPT